MRKINQDNCITRQKNKTDSVCDENRKKAYWENAEHIGHQGFHARIKEIFNERISVGSDQEIQGILASLNEINHGSASSNALSFWPSALPSRQGDTPKNASF